VSNCIVRSNGAAPILNYHHQVLQFQAIGQIGDGVRVLLRSKTIPGRRLGHTKAGVIEGDQTTFSTQFFDDVSVDIRPRRISVKQENDGTLSFVNIVDITIAQR
jgi:hypothetical protein